MKRENQPKKSENKSVQCHGCKKTGHLKRECPNAKAGSYFKCGVAGHYAHDCGKSTNSTEKSASGQSTSASGKSVLVESQCL